MKQEKHGYMGGQERDGFVDKKIEEAMEEIGEGEKELRLNYAKELRAKLDILNDTMEEAQESIKKKNFDYFKSEKFKSILEEVGKIYRLPDEDIKKNGYIESVIRSYMGHDCAGVIAPVVGYKQMIEQQIKNLDFSSEKTVKAFLNEDWDRFERNWERYFLLSKSIAVQVANEKEVHKEFQKRIKLDKVLKNLSKYLEKGHSSRIKIEINIDPEIEEAEVQGDEGIIYRQLYSIIRNPVGKTRYFEVNKLCLDVSKEGEQLVIKISDDGKGMDKEILEQIFTKGFTTGKEMGGQGLGLGNVDSQILSMGGNLTVETTDRKSRKSYLYIPQAEEKVQEIKRDREGTEFTITFPIINK